MGGAAAGDTDVRALKFEPQPPATPRKADLTSFHTADCRNGTYTHCYTCCTCYMYNMTCTARGVFQHHTQDQAENERVRATQPGESGQLLFSARAHASASHIDRRPAQASASARGPATGSSTSHTQVKACPRGRAHALATMLVAAATLNVRLHRATTARARRAPLPHAAGR